MPRLLSIGPSSRPAFTEVFAVAIEMPRADHAQPVQSCEKNYPQQPGSNSTDQAIRLLLLANKQKGTLRFVLLLLSFLGLAPTAHRRSYLPAVPQGLPTKKSGLAPLRGVYF